MGWCLSTRFLKCKKIDLLDKCSPDAPEPIAGVPTTAPTEKIEPVCIPDYDLYSVKNIMVEQNNQIGEVNMFDNNFYLDMTIQTPPKGAESGFDQFWNSVVSFGHNETISVKLMAKSMSSYRTGGLCIHIAGLDKSCLGTKFVWTMEHNVRIQIYFQTKQYVKIVINRGKNDEYKEYGHKYGDHTPVMTPHPLVLPIFTGMGDEVAEGVTIQNLKLKSWMVDMLQTAKKNTKHGMGDSAAGGGANGQSGNGGPDEEELVGYEYMFGEEYEDFGEYEDLLFREEDEERLAEQQMLNVGGFSVGYRHKVIGTAALDLKLLGVLMFVIVCGGGYYYYKSRQVKYVLLSNLDEV